MPKVKTSKEDIIKKVLSVFKQKGYPNATISVLAKACELEKAHLYYYFKNKEDLMREVLLYLKEDTYNKILSQAYIDAEDASLRLSTVLKGLEKLYLEVSTGCLMANTIIQTPDSNSNFMDVAQDFCNQLIDTISHLYQERYSEKYARGKAEQAVQDMYGGLVFSQIFGDDQYFLRALNRIKKKV
ncbi:MAG: TetR/AcrR family transcriptional regulator [Aureispira sp.]|nr:TetR/AcrR family transcriptional regulator [Aureispira sp.]